MNNTVNNTRNNTRNNTVNNTRNNTRNNILNDIYISELSFQFIENPVPSSYSFSKDHNFMILIGPNMSGKSLYVVSFLHAIFMSQIGFPIHAVIGKMTIIDEIYFIDAQSSLVSLLKYIKKCRTIANSRNKVVLVIINELKKRMFKKESLLTLAETKNIYVILISYDLEILELFAKHSNVFLKQTEYFQLTKSQGVNFEKYLPAELIEKYKIYKNILQQYIYK